MCGILGIVGANYEVSEELATRLLIGLKHRGPDDEGVWRDTACGLLLGHTRLSIVDLSPAGHQPMISSCGRYVLVFNGEIYNHMTLRDQLGSRPWRGHSDTETLLAYFAERGVERTLKATVGMFALALWDRTEQKLYLARDRLGEKPLYYGFVGSAFVFCSELTPLRSLPGFSGEVDREALALYIRHNCVPSPYCIYRDLRKLPAGCWIEIAAGSGIRKMMPELQQYWSVRQSVVDGQREPFSFKNDVQAVDALEDIMGQAVAGQMMADVPLGAFLSGGVDSSSVVALMQKHSNRPVKTFSIGFEEEGYNEAKHAKLVAQHLGTDHTELYVAAQDALAVIPKLSLIYDEPFADSSQIPTYLVAQMARQHVTVALSGDGGDELFGGYNRYFLAARMWERLEKVPLSFRRGIAGAIRVLPADRWNRLLHPVSPLFPKRYQVSLPGDKLHKGAGVLDSSNGGELYRNLTSHWVPEVIGLSEPAQGGGKVHWSESLGITQMMMSRDAETYLPDDILVKVDRAAMAVSLETRVPMLDHRIFEFAWRLPMHYKVRDGVGKWILRQMLYRHVPEAMIERPKMGFGVPLAAWLRGPLKEWAAELLGEARLKREGFFDPEPIRQKWLEHLSGQRNWHYQLWDVLMFQAWLDNQCLKRLNT
jgi:asparagine synthase (glutamine-hydrolysing)